MIYPACVREIERTWTENGWQTINPPATPSGRDAMTREGRGWEILDRPEKAAASNREPGMAGSLNPLGRRRPGVPTSPRCLNIAADKLGR
jgi:hypothetical protein